MRIGPSLILASRQTLAMTPQLQQAIKLLQFSHLELAAFIQQELEKNPLLQETQPDDGPIAEADAGPISTPADTAEALAAAAPALADADERWTREHADRGGDGTASRVGQRDDVFRCARLRGPSGRGAPGRLAAYPAHRSDLSESQRPRMALKLAEGLTDGGLGRRLERPALRRWASDPKWSRRWAPACARSSRPVCSRAPSRKVWAPTLPSAIGSTRR
jgi:RNA polymerase sigma-54 factor